MKRFLAVLLIAVVAASAYSLTAAAKKKKKPRFGVARVQGVEPNVAIESGISDPKNVGFDIVAPTNAVLTASWVLSCVQGEEVLTDEGTYSEMQGEQSLMTTVFNENIYGDSSACYLDVTAESEGTGTIVVKLRGAGDVPTEELPPEPTPTPIPDPTPSP